MSRGLGAVERRILEALQATERPYATLYELTVLVEGRIRTLDEPWTHWDTTICEPHPRIRNGLGSWVDHMGKCYPPRPSESVREATSRAVRSLARKGLVHCEYEGMKPKQLVVCLPGTDRAKLPEGQRWEQWVRFHVQLGVPMPIEHTYTRRYWPRPREHRAYMMEYRQSNV
jgi:hypothetical protein